VASAATVAFLAVWVGVFAVAAAGLFLLTWLKARQRGEPAWTPIARTALWAMLGPWLAGLAGTIGLAVAGQWDLLPGLWLLFHGCAFYGVSFFAPLFLRTLSLAFMALGLTAWLTSPQWPALWLGLGFGGLHLVFGGIVLARYRR